MHAVVHLAQKPVQTDEHQNEDDQTLQGATHRLIVRQKGSRGKPAAPDATPRAAGRLDLRGVDLAGGLVPAENHEKSTKGEVLTNHHPELDDLGLGEVLAKLGLERLVDTAEVRRAPLRPPDGQIVTRREASLAFGLVDLGNRRFVQTFTHRRCVAREKSSVALIQCRDLQARELLHPARNHALLVTGPEEREVALKEVG